MIVTLLLRVRDRCKRRLVSSFTDENTSLVAFVMEIRYLWANFFRADRGKQKRKTLDGKFMQLTGCPLGQIGGSTWAPRVVTHFSIGFFLAFIFIGPLSLQFPERNVLAISIWFTTISDRMINQIKVKSIR